METNGNTQPTPNYRSGVPGVRWDKEKQRWEARISHKGKRMRLGRYKTVDEAIEARKEAEKRLAFAAHLAQR